MSIKPVMSMFTTELDCLRAREKWYFARNAELEQQLEAARKDAERNKAFIAGVMESWPDGDLDGGTLQELAIKHGIIKLRTHADTVACNVTGDCRCAGIYDVRSFEAGTVECYERDYQEKDYG